MSVLLSFLCGTALFHLFAYFPATSAAVFLAASVRLALGAKKINHAQNEKENGSHKDTKITKINLSVKQIAISSPCTSWLRVRNFFGSRCAGLGKAFLLIPVIILGFLYAQTRHVTPADTSTLIGKEVLIDCVTDGSSRPLPSGRFSDRVKVVAAVIPFTGETPGSLKEREITVVSDEGLPRNVRCELLVKMGQDTERLNPGFVAEKRPYAYLKAAGRVEKVAANGLFSRLRERRDLLNLYLRENFDADSGAFLASITTGERADMSEEMKEAFGSTGLAHLLSISGTHFGLFSMLIFGVFRLCITVMPYRYLLRLTLYLTPSQAAALLSLPFMLTYLLISDLSFPALRSFIMITLFLFGLLLGRKGFWLNSLLFAALLICLWNPSAVLSLSFQLSFLAVLFIGFTLGQKKETPRDPGLRERVAGLLKNSLLLSLSASLGTAPLVAYYFHYFSIISPLSNILITPLIGFVLVPLSLVSSLAFIFSGHYPFQPLVALASEVSLKAVKLFASIPFADIKIPAFPVIALVIFYLGCLLYLAGWKRFAPASVILAVLIAAGSLAWKEKGLSVTYLDVGQGDSAVIETPGGKTLVIDTGRTGREAEAYLKYRGKGALNALILTHADDDHSGGAPRLLEKFTVGEVWDNGLLTYPDTLLSKAAHRSLERGDAIESGGIRIQTLHPYKGFYTLKGGEGRAENNDSLVLRITGRKSFLFAADTETEAEEDMVHLGSTLKSDVIKIAHHGSRTSSTEDFLRSVSPELAVVSVGRYNTYGHPHNETLERLRGMRVCRTDIDGAIKVTETSAERGELSVKTYRDFRFERASDLAGEWRNVKKLFQTW